MFFTSSPDLPFQTIREVMRAYPEWNLMMKEYFDAYFDFLAELGDPDYKVWLLTQLLSAVLTKLTLDFRVDTNIKVRLP